MEPYVHIGTSFLDCPDLGSLSWAHRGIFFALMLNHTRYPHVIDILEDTAWRIRCDIDEFREAISALTACGLIVVEGEKIVSFPSHLTKRPARPATYKQYLTSSHWKYVRQKALERADNQCERCGAHDVTLVAHHLTYNNLGDEQPEDLMVLCQSCHVLEHATGEFNA